MVDLWCALQELHVDVKISWFWEICSWTFTVHHRLHEEDDVASVLWRFSVHSGLARVFVWNGIVSAWRAHFQIHAQFDSQRSSHFQMFSPLLHFPPYFMLCFIFISNLFFQLWKIISIWKMLQKIPGFLLLVH